MATKKGLFILVLLLASIVGSIPRIALATPSQYAITRVQYKNRGTTTTPDTLTLDSAPTNGNTIIFAELVKKGTGFPQASAPTQVGVTYTKVGTYSYSTSGTIDINIWKGVVGAGAAAAITISCVASPTYYYGVAIEYAGQYTVGDYKQTNNTAGNPASGTTDAVNYAPCLGFAVFGNSGSYAASAPTNGFSLVYGSSVTISIHIYEKISTSPVTSFQTSVTQGGLYTCSSILALYPSNPTAYYYLMSSIYEDGTTLASQAITLSDATGTASLTVTNQEATYYLNGALTSVSFTAGTYTRVLYPKANGETIKIIVPQGGATSRVHLWTIRDLVGSATDGYLETRRVIGGTEYVVERNTIIDTINGIPSVMIDGGIYHVYVLESDKVTYHEFGYYLATSSSTDPILTLGDLSFDQEIQYVTTSLPIIAARTADKVNITLAWANTLTPTYNLTTSFFEVKNRAGTTVYSANSTAQSGTFEATGLSNTTDYVVYFDTTSGYFGAIEGAWAFEGFDGYADIPDLDDLGLTFGGIDSSSIIGVGLLVFVAGIFSAGSAPVGAVVTVLVGGMLARLGFISVTDTLLALALCLAVMFAVGKRGGTA